MKNVKNNQWQFYQQVRNHHTFNVKIVIKFKIMIVTQYNNDKKKLFSNNNKIYINTYK